MKDVVSGEVLTFKFRNCWVSAKEDDCDVWKEMAAVRPGKKGLPGKHMSVCLHVCLCVCLCVCVCVCVCLSVCLSV